MIAKQPEQAKHYIAGTRRVGHDFGGSQSGLLLKQPLQKKMESLKVPGITMP